MPARWMPSLVLGCGPDTVLCEHPDERQTSISITHLYLLLWLYSQGTIQAQRTDTCFKDWTDDFPKEMILELSHKKLVGISHSDKETAKALPGQRKSAYKIEVSMGC